MLLKYLYSETAMSGSSDSMWKIIWIWYYTLHSWAKPIPMLKILKVICFGPQVRKKILKLIYNSNFLIFRQLRSFSLLKFKSWKSLKVSEDTWICTDFKTSALIVNKQSWSVKPLESVKGLQVQSWRVTANQLQSILLWCILGNWCPLECVRQKVQTGSRKCLGVWNQVI